MPRLTTKAFNAKLINLHHALINDMRLVLRQELEVASRSFGISFDHGFLGSEGARTGGANVPCSTKLDAPSWRTKTSFDKGRPVYHKETLTGAKTLETSGLLTFIEEDEAAEEEEGANRNRPQQPKEKLSHVMPASSSAIQSEGINLTLVDRTNSTAFQKKDSQMESMFSEMLDRKSVAGKTNKALLADVRRPDMEFQPRCVSTEPLDSTIQHYMEDSIKPLPSVDSVQFGGLRSSTESIDARVVEIARSTDSEVRCIGSKRFRLVASGVGGDIKPIAVGRQHSSADFQAKLTDSQYRQFHSFDEDLNPIVETTSSNFKSITTPIDEDVHPPVATLSSTCLRNVSFEDIPEICLTQRPPQEAHVSLPGHQLTTSTGALNHHSTTWNGRKRFKLLPAWAEIKKHCKEEMRQHCLDSIWREPTIGLQRIHKYKCTTTLDELLFPYVADPHGPVRTVWSFVTLLLVSYEVAVVPPECLIGFPPSLFTTAMKWLCAFFWTLDVPLNFMTGYIGEKGLEQQPSMILINYLRTWLAFDLMLVAFEWLCVHTEDSTSYPMIRTLRLLRIYKLLRIAQVQQIVRDIMAVAPDFIVSCAELLKIILALCVLVHILACAWFAIGTWDRGWVTTSDVKNAPFAEKYQRALHWTITQIHGGIPSEPDVAVEFMFSICIQCCGFIITAFLIGKTAHAVMSHADARKQHLRQVCRRYLRTRKVSTKLQFDLNRYLSKGHRSTLKQQLEYESEMLKSLPESFLMDLQEEVRRPLLLRLPFFGELNQIMLRMLCYEALSSVVAVRPEFVFEYGVLCTRMLWVESGNLIYVQGPLRRAKKLSNVGKSAAKDDDSGLRRYLGKMSRGRDLEIMTRGSFLCEATLWTEWFHCGEFVAESDSTMLALEVSRFMSVITKMENCVTLTINYAHSYITELNKVLFSGGKLSDTVNICQRSTFSVSQPFENHVFYEHLVFLSHFKQEAGTEASLMEAGLNRIIRDDPSHPASIFTSPCFIDSEDLVDLRGLTDHVANCHNLIVLLTPQVLTRPWCLIEIVTAVRHGVNLVPVEIQRPGLGFEYPDEKFFNALSRGEKLTKEAVALLKEEGVELQELATCVRQVFLKIALPFSPHKSATIRNAELLDILARCVIRKDDDEGRCPRTSQ